MMNRPPEELIDWIKCEQQYCFGAANYGETLKEILHEAAPRIAVELQEERDTGQHLHNQGIIDSLASDYGIPGFQGVVDLCLDSVKRADEQCNGRVLENVVTTTLATNERYAAVYAPHMAPNWHVIGLDWGIICGLWGLSVVFAHVMSDAGIVGERDLGLICTDEKRMAEAVARSEPVAKLTAESVLPSILMGIVAPVPLANDDAKLSGLGEILFEFMVYSLIAHEYSHLWLGHLDEWNCSSERRHDLEFEADAMALGFILANPREEKYGEDLALILGVGAQCIVFSLLRMLDTGDKILKDFGHPRSSSETHPTPVERMIKTEIFLQSLFDEEEGESSIPSLARQTLSRFTDDAWNLSLDFVISEIETCSSVGICPQVKTLRDEELCFL